MLILSILEYGRSFYLLISSSIISSEVWHVYQASFILACLELPQGKLWIFSLEFFFFLIELLIRVGLPMTLLMSPWTYFLLLECLLQSWHESICLVLLDLIMLSSVDISGKLLFSEGNQWRRSGSRGDKRCGGGLFWGSEKRREEREQTL